ncbi:MAG TPA: cytidylate kinase family protein [Candidatus Eisenbacteria bacterium]|jgi:cytidylate kinase|nr:cytidylate kinase family protein [Candidatus Eisenbacteria bacterium]
MAILTISHEMGSGGAEIGMALATRLAYTYVDNEELLARAQRYGLGEERLARLVEDRPSWVERFDAETRRCILALQAVLYEFAQADNVVMIGGGGQWLLRGVPHALRTRIVAPFPERVTRLTATLSAQGRERVTPKTVAQFIRRDDIQKAARMRYLFDADVKDPGLYDVLINTAAFSREAAVTLLAEVARRPEFATTDAARQLVEDRVVASQVEVALAGHPDMRRYRIDVESTCGLVTLELPAGVDPEDALAVAKSVEGVRDVKLRIAELPVATPFPG